MERQEIAEQIKKTLAKSGFAISEQCFNMSFDIIGKRENIILIIKILYNVESFDRKTANDIKIVAKFLQGSPLLIGENFSSGKLQDGVIYLRHGVPLITKNTLKDYFIEGIPPFVYSAPGGFYVNIDKEMIKKIREEKNLSLGELAKQCSVSRKAIQLYEEGTSPSVDVALKLEEFLGKELITPLNLFSYSEEYEENIINIEKFEKLERTIFSQLKGIGYEVIPTIKCPFNAFTQNKKNIILTGVGKKDILLHKKAKTISSISKITEKHSVFFIEKTEKKNIEGMPIIKKDELKKLCHEEIIELILEREVWGK